MNRKIILKSFSLIALLCSLSSFKSQTIKLPKTIKIDTIIEDYSKYLISYNFEYNNKNQLLKIIDSTKDKDKIIVQEMNFKYNNEGRLLEYTHKKKSSITHYEMVYEKNKIVMFPNKSSYNKLTILLDDSQKAIEIREVNEENSYFNGISYPVYDENGNLEKLKSAKFEYGVSKGIFSDINMDSWLRIFLSNQFSSAFMNFSKNILIKRSKENSFKMNLIYVIENDYPIKIINPLITYKVEYIE